MSFAAHHDLKEQVRQSVDIVDLVGSHLQLRRQGTMYVGLCPWHDDARPSLQVNPQRQSWKCWVCDLGGDVFSFVMQREGVDFREALELLADRAGIALARSSAPAPAPGTPGDKRALYQALAWAESEFHQCLLKSPEAEPARIYLHERQIAAESIERFKLGFSPNQWQWLWERGRRAGFSPEVLTATGLIGKSEQGSHYDRFKGRVIFPIRDVQSRPIAFGGRVLPVWADDRSAKYINSPETRLFSKSEQLYALDLVRETLSRLRHIVVVEGYTDVVMAHQCGVGNAVAVLGTALTMRHVQLLRRYADRITLVLDGDEAGQRRTNEVLELFIAADVDLRILTLPEGLDPCDFLHREGGEAFNQMLGGARDALEHRIHTETLGLDLVRDTHRSHQALERILATMAKAPRASVASAQRLREQQLVTRLSRQFQVPADRLMQRLSDLQRPSRVLREAETSSTPVLPPLTLEPVEAELLEILVLHPELVGEALASTHIEALPSAAAQEVLRTYRRLLDEERGVEFETLMTAVEDGRIKNLLVKLDEQAQAKASQAQDTGVVRLRGLIRDLEMKHVEKECRQRLAALEAHSLDEQEEYNTFLELVQKERDRRGISAPTDG